MESQNKYEDLTVFQKPCCLVGTGRGDTLEIDRHVSREIQRIQEELVVVAIAGPYRTGKSYLLNRLAGYNWGFPLGSTIESMTKGLWVWCTWHPNKEDKVLLLLDTEGLGDIQKGSQKHDVWILTLALLLCSTLVYNVLSVMSQDVVEKLDLVAEVAKKLLNKRSSEISTFPDLVLSLRDFFLNLEIDNKEVNADDYLEHSLELKVDDGTDGAVKTYNEQRERINQCFPRRKCFTFERPAGKRVLKRLSEVTDEELDPDFLIQTEEFCRYIFEKSPVKLIDVDIPANGRTFCDLVETYVGGILHGDLPNFHDALEALCIKECQRATDESLAMYLGIMFASIDIPTNRLDTIHSAHDSCLHEILEIFRGRAMKDDKGEFMEKLIMTLSQEFESIYQQNRDESFKRSQSLVQELYTPIVDKVLSGHYNRRFGFLEYRNDRFKMREEYVEHVHVLGYMALEVLEDFEKEKEMESEMLQQLDLKITEHNIRMEDLQAEIDKINQETETQKESTQENERRLQETHQTYQRQLRDLEEKHQADIQNVQQTLQQKCSEALSRQRENLNQAHQHQLGALRRQLH